MPVTLPLNGDLSHRYQVPTNSYHEFKMETITIQTKNNHTINGSLFLAEKPINTVVIINSAMGVLRKYYADFASHLALEGLHVITYDYYGIGESGSTEINAIQTDIVGWAQEDYASVIGYAKTRFQKYRLLVLGHSVGGQIIGMTSKSRLVDAFMIVASQTPYWPNFRFQLKIWLLWNFMIPALTPLFGYFPARKIGLFENLPEKVAFQWRRCAKHANYIFNERPELRAQYESLTQPIKVISLSDDPYAPKKAVDDLIRFYSKAKLDNQHISPNEIGEKRIGHFGFFRKRFAPTLWKDATFWLKMQSHSHAL